MAVPFLVCFCVGIGGRFQLRSTFADLDGVDRQLTLVVVELELEAVGEQLLQHLLLLAQAGFARSIRCAFDVEAVAGNRIGRIDDLTRVDGVGEHDEAGDALVANREAIANSIEALAVRGGVMRLDGGDGERGVRVGGHGLHRRLCQRLYGCKYDDGESRFPWTIVHRKAPSV